MKLGEKLMFGFAVLIRGGGGRQGSAPVHRYRAGQGRATSTCGRRRASRGTPCTGAWAATVCHRALGVGEIGVAPVLDGEGTRRTKEWLAAYFQDPASLVPGTAHDGSLGPDLRRLGDRERELVVAFLAGLRANPGSPNHPRPPPEAIVRGGG